MEHLVDLDTLHTNDGGIIGFTREWNFMVSLSYYSAQRVSKSLFSQSYRLLANTICER